MREAGAVCKLKRVPGHLRTGKMADKRLRTPAPRFAGQTPKWRGFLSRVCNQVNSVSVGILHYSMRCRFAGIRGNNRKRHQTGNVLLKPGNDPAPHLLPREKRPARAWYTILFP